MENKGFIPIEKINKEMFKRQFQYKRNWLKVVGGVGCMGVSFILPDMCIGLVVGMMLLNPISIRKQLRNKKEDAKHFITKRLMLWGWI